MEKSICLDCGICCDGTLHGKATINKGTQSNGTYNESKIELYKFESVSFALPCVEFSNTRGCQIYKTRPEVCRVYRCKLLIDVESNRVQYNSALKTIQSIKKNRDVLKAHLDEQEELAKRNVSATDKGNDKRLSLINRFLEKYQDDLSDIEKMREFAGNYGDVFKSYVAFDALLNKFHLNRNNTK